MILVVSVSTVNQLIFLRTVNALKAIQDAWSQILSMKNSALSVDLGRDYKTKGVKESSIVKYSQESAKNVHPIIN